MELVNGSIDISNLVLKLHTNSLQVFPCVYSSDYLDTRLDSASRLIVFTVTGGIDQFNNAPVNAESVHPSVRVASTLFATACSTLELQLATRRSPALLMAHRRPMIAHSNWILVFTTG